MKKSSWVYVVVLLLIICLFVGCRSKKTPPPDSKDMIKIDSRYTADFKADTIEEKYAGAYSINPDQIINFSEWDSSIKVDFDPDNPGEITFTNTLPRQPHKNQYVRIAYKNGWGLLNLTVLHGETGKIGIAVHGDLDLSDNGFYVKVKSDSKDVGAYKRIVAGTSLTGYNL